MYKYFHILWHRQLGAGGEGIVVLARSVTSGRPYAAKFPNILVPTLAQLRLRGELNRVLRVRGNAVARPVAWNLEGARPFLVYEYARFGSLRHEMNDVFESGKVYHPIFALRRVYQMLLGVRDAHRAGLVHRDVKPDNYLLYEDNDVRLSDFGLGRTLNRPFSWSAGGFVGTPMYAAPEQLAGLPVDGRADLYSVGVVLYEMLVGLAPNRRCLIPPSRLRPSITASLDALCMRMLAWHRFNRPQTVDRAISEVVYVWREYLDLRRRYAPVGLQSPV